MKNMKYNHLNMIQAVIERMSNNSFFMKGWAITLMVAIFAFASEREPSQILLITVIPLFVLWCLDSYYLQIEKKYRRLSELVRLKKESEIDYDMDYSKAVITLGDTSKFCYIRSCLFSKTEAPFYLALIITSVLIYFLGGAN